MESDWAGKRVMCRACGKVSTVSGQMLASPRVVTPPLKNPIHPAAPPEPVAPTRVFGKGDTLVPALFLGYSAALTAFLGFQAFYVSTTMDRSDRALGFFLVGIVQPVVFGFLVFLGVHLASKTKTFERRPGLRWRCLAVAGTLLLAPLATQVFDLGRTWTVVLRIGALAAATGLLWFVLRLTGRRFILPALFGIGFPVVAWLAVAAVLALLQQRRESDWARFEESEMRSVIEIRTSRQTIPAWVSRTDPNAVLTSLAGAEQSYFKSHGDVYASTEGNLASAGFAERMFVDPGTAARLRYRTDLPRIAPLPADLIVATILDSDESGYTVLFGDWRTRHITVAEWPDFSRRSNAALIDAVRNR